MALKTHISVLQKKDSCQKWETGLKICFLDLLKNSVIIFYLNLVYNESLYYLLYSCTNPIFGKSLVPEIWAKMCLANQIVGFLNQLHIYNPDHNILRHFDVWQNFRVATSETNRGY